MREIIKLNRDVIAIQVPFGTHCTLSKDTEVAVLYALGGSYTVTTPGNMYRIANLDADALGKIDDTLTPTKTEKNSTATLENRIWLMLRSCYDPEIPVNIVDLGLIYGVDITALDDPTDPNKFDVVIRMTLTAPGCGMGPIIAADAKQKVLSLSEVKAVTIQMVFDPPWDRTMMSEQAKLELGLF